MTPADRAALEIGRLFMRAHAAEQAMAALEHRASAAELSLEQMEEINLDLTAERDALQKKLGKVQASQES